MIKVDFHLHSYFSDGENSPEEIFTRAKKNEITFLSLVDHNHIPESIDKYKKIASDIGCTILEGVEISCLDRDLDMSFHVLGYSNHFDRNFVNTKLQSTLDGYNRRAKNIIDKLNSEFLSLNLYFEDIKNNGNEAYVSRNTLARKIVDFLENKISIKKALKKYIFVEENDSWMLSPKECFEIISSGGGVPVLAHSGRELRKIGAESYKKMITNFKNQGLQGIEVYYPKHSEKEISEIKNIALENSLFITGGSDWHGESYTPDAKLGVLMKEIELKTFIDSVEKSKIIQ